MIKRKENNSPDNGTTSVRYYLFTDRGYRQLIDNFPAFILGIELDGTISIFNKFAQTVTGISEEEITGKKISEIISTGDFFLDSQNIKLPPQGVESQIISADNTPKYIKWYFIPILNRQGTLLGWGAFGSDVTEEKKRIEEIQFLALMSRKIIDSIPHSIFLLDSDLNIVDANRFQMEKKDKNDILSMNIRDFFPPKFLKESGLLEALHNCLTTNTPANLIEVSLADGVDDGKWVNIRIYPLQSAPKSGLFSLILLIEDVTNYVKMRDRLQTANQSLMNANQELQHTMEKLREAQFETIKSEKMATIGQLAAGMAHEINNPLGYLLSNMTAVSNYMWDIKKAVNELRSLIRASGEEELLAKLKEVEQELNLDFLFEDTRAIIEENIDGLLRIKGIIRELSTFSLARMGQYEWVDVNKLIDATLQMVYNTIKHKAVLKKFYGEQLPTIYADPAKLGQVFLSIITNAAQAIEEGNAAANTIEIITTYGEGNNIYVSIRDTGCGISEECLPKIFDPFYTTKNVGEGTGMGLAVSLSIMKDMGGDIQVKSKVGEGSTFTIVIPPVPKIREKNEISGETIQEIPELQQKSRILIIDDEEKILSSYKRLLKTQFDVITAKGGKIALDILSSDTAFEAIICDVMMPEIDGKYVYEFIKEKIPHLLDRLIFLTGGTFTHRTSKFISEIKNPVLDKPVEFHILLTTVKQTIELAKLRKKSATPKSPSSS